MSKREIADGLRQAANQLQHGGASWEDTAALLESLLAAVRDNVATGESEDA